MLNESIFTNDTWEYRFVERTNVVFDDYSDVTRRLFEERSAQNNHSEDGHPTELSELESELSELKEFLNALPSAKKEALSSDGEKVILLRTYLGNDSEIICPESIDGHAVVRLSSSIFSKCKNMIRKLTIPPSVQQIPWGLFRNCPELETIEILGSSKYYDVIDDCLYEKSDGAIIFCNRNKGAVTIPGNTRRISTYTFSDCNRLSEVTITSNDITLPKNLFIDCKGLKTLRLPNSFVVFDLEGGIRSRNYPATAYNLDLTSCGSLSDVYYDGTWEQWLQKPVCVCGAVTIHVQDGTLHNDRRLDFFAELMAKLVERMKTDQ